MKIQIHLIVLCLVAVLAMSPAGALTLHDIELNSYLNQVLDARIRLDGLESGDLESLQMRVLEPDMAMGITPSMLKLEVKEDGNGHYIQITSRESIREPILSFSLELTWAGGRFIRDYSLLMDPQK